MIWRRRHTANAQGGPYVQPGQHRHLWRNDLLFPVEAEPDEHRWQIFDVISRTRGKHTFKAGVDLNFIHEIMINLFQGDGGYSYTGAAGAAFTNWVQDVYNVNGGRPALQHLHSGCGSGHRRRQDDFWNQSISRPFAEDSWKILPKLTITAGLRYDVQLVPQPPRPFTTSGNGATTQFGRSFTTVINTNYKMFQPRIGFAYNPVAGTVVRGGYGIFYGLIPLSAYYNIRVENGVFQQQYNLNPSAGVYPDTALVGLDVLFTPPGARLWRLRLPVRIHRQRWRRSCQPGTQPPRSGPEVHRAVHPLDGSLGRAAADPDHIADAELRRNARDASALLYRRQPTGVPARPAPMTW